MEVRCCLGWIEDVVKWRHPTVTIVDTDGDMSISGNRCPHQQCFLFLINVQLELPVHLYNMTHDDITLDSFILTVN